MSSFKVHCWNQNGPVQVFTRYQSNLGPEWFHCSIFECQTPWTPRAYFQQQQKKLVVLPYYSAISKELQRIFLQTWGGGLFHSWCKSCINRNSKIQTTWRVTFFIFGHSSFLSWDSERDFECRKEILNLSRIFQNVQTCLYINALGRVQVG